MFKDYDNKKELNFLHIYPFNVLLITMLDIFFTKILVPYQELLVRHTHVIELETIRNYSNLNNGSQAYLPTPNSSSDLWLIPLIIFIVFEMNCDLNHV